MEGITSPPFGLHQVVHELHRVLSLLLGLLDEELREKRELTFLKMRCDAEILHARAELLSDLRVDCRSEFGAD